MLGSPNDAFPAIELPRRAATADLLVIMIVVVCVPLLAIFALAPLLDARSLPRGAHFLLPVFNGLVCMTAVGLLLRRRRQGTASIGLERRPLLQVILAATIAVPCAYLAGAFTNVGVTLLTGDDFISFAKERVDFLEKVSDISVGWILPVSLFIGLYEEILFRGFILSRLRALSRNNAAPIVISSALFGALHFTQGLTGVVQTGVVGLVLAVTATKARTIWPCILAHAAIDTLSLLFAAYFAGDLQALLRQLATQPG